MLSTEVILSTYSLWKRYVFGPNFFSSLHPMGYSGPSPSSFMQVSLFQVISLGTQTWWYDSAAFGLTVLLIMLPYQVEYVPSWLAFDSNRLVSRVLAEFSLCLHASMNFETSQHKVSEEENGTNLAVYQGQHTRRFQLLRRPCSRMPYYRLRPRFERFSRFQDRLLLGLAVLVRSSGPANMVPLSFAEENNEILSTTG